MLQKVAIRREVSLTSALLMSVVIHNLPPPSCPVIELRLIRTYDQGPLISLTDEADGLFSGVGRGMPPQKDPNAARHAN